MRHHTKDKGDIGLAKAIADLTEKGIQCCLPISEHLPFDLIAVSEQGGLCRVQVRYTAEKNGVLEIKLRSTKYNNTVGAYNKSPDLAQIDVLAIYSPSNNGVYYISKSKLINHVNTFSIRLVKPKQAQEHNWHEDFLNTDILWVGNLSM